MSDMLSYT